MPPLIPILVFLAIIAAVFDAGALAVVCYFLIAIYLFVRWWLGRVPSVLSYHRVHDTHLFFDETATVTLELRNRSVIPIPWLQYHERLPLRLGYSAPYQGVVYLPANGTRKLAYKVRGTRRGLYELGPLTLGYGDIFGFEDRTIRGGSVDRLTVYPKIVPLEQLLLPSRSPLGALRSRNPLSEDPSRVIGVRDYQRGDSMRRIHWPATARAGKLQVKKLEPAMTLQTVILLDLHPEYYDQQLVDEYQELAIVAAASFAHGLIELRQAVGLICNGIDLLTVPSGPLGGAVAASGASLNGAAHPNGTPDALGAVADSAALVGGDVLPSIVSGAITIPAARGHGHLIRLLETLARVERSSHLPFSQLLRQHTRGLGWGTTVVVITGGHSAALAPDLASLQRSGYIVLRVVAGGRQYGGESTASLPTYRIRAEADLAGVAEVLRG